VDAVDKHFIKAKKNGAKIIEKPADTFYGDGVTRQRIRKVISGRLRNRCGKCPRRKCGKPQRSNAVEKETLRPTAEPGAKNLPRFAGCDREDLAR
jgi:hypothetical protein